MQLLFNKELAEEKKVSFGNGLYNLERKTHYL